MRCPDINRFLDAMDEGGFPADLEAHLESCTLCRSRLRILDELPAVLRPDTVVPERMLLLAMEGFQAAKRAEQARMPVPQVVGSTILGFVSVLGVLIFTGAGGGTGPAAPLLLASAVGVGAGVYFRWWVWPGTPDDGEVRQPEEP